MNFNQKRVIVRKHICTHDQKNKQVSNNTRESVYIFPELAEAKYDQLMSVGFTFEMDAEIREQFNKLLYEYSRRQPDPNILIKKKQLRMGEIFDYVFIRFCNKLKAGEISEKDYEHFTTTIKPKNVIKRHFKVRCKDHLNEVVSILSEKTGVKLARKDCAVGMMKYILSCRRLDF